jgi:hypothetical protein
MINRWFVVLASLACLILATPLAAETPAASVAKFGNMPLVFEPTSGKPMRP